MVFRLNQYTGLPDDVGTASSIADGDKGDITVSGSGATWTIDNPAVALLTGTNSGDQTSIVGITGSLAEFNAALTGADFATGGGTVSGTSSGTNTGDQDLSGKQDTLVSGTSIKTVNGNTLLGSGDVSISSAIAWGDVTGTLSSQTDLQTALDAKLDDSQLGVTVQGYSAVLAATTASFLLADETKLDGIAAGAEVNVNADWNSVAGDSQILNKPTISGSNTGDQTSIVGITGTKDQFDTAVTDGNILYVGDVTQYTDELAQDAVGNILTDSAEIDFTYNDGAPSITASIVASSIDEAKLDASVNASLDLADTSVQLAFKTIAVSGQSDVVADTATDTLTLVAGSNITITTNAGTDSITITASVPGGSGITLGAAIATAQGCNGF